MTPNVFFLLQKPRKNAEILQLFLQVSVLLHYKVVAFVRFCGLMAGKAQDEVSW